MQPAKMEKEQVQGASVLVKNYQKKNSKSFTVK